MMASVQRGMPKEGVALVVMGEVVARDLNVLLICLAAQKGWYI